MVPGDSGALGSLEEWRSALYPSTSNYTRASFGAPLSLLLEAGTEEKLGGACRLCVFTRGAIGEAQGRLGWAAFEDRAVLVTSTPVRLLFLLFSSHLS